MGHLDDVKPDLENETRRKSENPYSGVTSFENINIRHPRAQLTPYTVGDPTVHLEEALAGRESALHKWRMLTPKGELSLESDNGPVRV